MQESKNGILYAFCIIFLPILIFIIIYPYSRAISFESVLRIYTRLPVVIFFLLLFSGVYVYLLRKMHFIAEFLSGGIPDQLESVQKLLVKLPKTMLMLGMLCGIAIPQILLFFHPNSGSMRPDAVILGFGNVIFFGMPPYILFVQRFETWAGRVPFSDEYQSMKLSTRVNLVSTFVLISMSGMLMVTLKNSFADFAGAADIRVLWGRGLPILIVGFVGGIVNLVLLMRGITGRIILCQRYADTLSQGIISNDQVIAVSRDELGVLADRLAKVRINTHGLIDSAKSTIEESIGVKEELGTMSEKAVAAVDGLTEQIGSVVSQIESLDERIDGTAGSVGVFSEKIENLTDGIMDQAAMTEESNAGITEMIASVENISEVARVKIRNSESLTAAAEEGSRAIGETVSRVNEIMEHADKINEISGLLKGIASKTNLLAMNAAIEAAHAGDAGKGFAVVADEIRKLASNAAENSSMINESVNRITLSITSANESGDSSTKSFRHLEGEISQVVNSFQEIEAGLGELKAGGVHVLEAVTSLNKSSQDLKSDADSMKEETRTTGRTVSDLRELSKVTSDVTEKMTSEVVVVKEQIDSIKEQAVRLDEATRKAAESLEGFRT